MTSDEVQIKSKLQTESRKLQGIFLIKKDNDEEFFYQNNLFTIVQNHPNTPANIELTL